MGISTTLTNTEPCAVIYTRNYAIRNGCLLSFKQNICFEELNPFYSSSRIRDWSLYRLAAALGGGRNSAQTALTFDSAITMAPLAQPALDHHSNFARGSMLVATR
jgi:hypothetical protein